MAKILVGIPCYGACEYLSTTLKSLRDQTFKDFETLIYVDGIQGSTGRIPNSDTDIILTRENRGLGTAYYEIGAWAHRRGIPYTFLLDNDAWLPPIFLELAAKLFEYNPWLEYAGWKSEKPNEEAPLLGSIELPPSFFPIAEYTTQLCGCGLMFNTKHYDLFDRQYRVFYQDSDFCGRIEGPGVRMWGPKLWHVEHQTIEASIKLTSYKEQDYDHYISKWEVSPEQTELEYREYLKEFFQEEKLQFPMPDGSLKEVTVQ